MKTLMKLSVAAFLALICIGCGPSRREQALALAPQVSQFGATRFDELDQNKDGTISEGELVDALLSEKFNASEKELLKHVQSYIDSIGHVTSNETRSTVTMMPMSDGNGGFTYLYIPGTETIYHYGINRDDFKTYPTRLLKP